MPPARIDSHSELSDQSEDEASYIKTSRCKESQYLDTQAGDDDEESDDSTELDEDGDIPDLIDDESDDESDDQESSHRELDQLTRDVSDSPVFRNNKQAVSHMRAKYADADKRRRSRRSPDATSQETVKTEDLGDSSDLGDASDLGEVPDIGNVPDIGDAQDLGDAQEDLGIYDDVDIFEQDTTVSDDEQPLDDARPLNRGASTTNQTVEFDQEFSELDGTYAQLTSAELRHSSRCYLLAGQQSIGTPRLFEEFGQNHICFACHCQVQVRRHWQSTEDGIIRCELMWMAHRPVLNQALAHRWTEHRDSLALGDMLTARLNKCVEYRFAASLASTACIPEQRGWPGSGERESNFVFCKDWMRTLYVQILAAMAVSAQEDTVTLLGHVIHKRSGVQMSATAHQEDGFVSYTLQTFVHSLTAASEWLQKHYGAHTVHFDLVH